MRIAYNLSKIIKEKNVKIYEMSKESGVHHSLIYRILTEENKNPKIDTMKRLADYLEVTVDDLIK